jgi:hypothetical protein
MILEYNIHLMCSSANPFERETPFRQSISEKRRLVQQPNNQALQWKQQSFHDTRTNSERREFKFRKLFFRNLFLIKHFVVLKSSVNFYLLINLTYCFE